MPSLVISQLDRFGPEHCETMSREEAIQWCWQLTRTQYENFSVLSGLVPQRLRDDFAALYAFCRWADDLGDEIGDPQRSLELLGWWRSELQACFGGEPRHPVFIALQPVVEKHDLPIDPFDHLIRAFEQDQRVTRYQTWDELLGYCRLSADPVGRLVLMICGEARDAETFALSDATCTALQITNHLQDMKRDLLERDRIYVPLEFFPGEDFESRFRRSAAQGFGVDQPFLGQSREMVKRGVDQTWPLYEEGDTVLPRLRGETRPIIRLLASGGMHVLRLIELWNYETVLHRPELGKLTRISLVARAWLSAKRAQRSGGTRNGSGRAEAAVAPAGAEAG